MLLYLVFYFLLALSSQGAVIAGLCIPLVVSHDDQRALRDRVTPPSRVQRRSAVLSVAACVGRSVDVLGHWMRLARCSWSLSRAAHQKAASSSQASKMPPTMNHLRKEWVSHMGGSAAEATTVARGSFETGRKGIPVQVRPITVCSACRKSCASSTTAPVLSPVRWMATLSA